MSRSSLRAPDDRNQGEAKGTARVGGRGNQRGRCVADGEGRDAPALARLEGVLIGSQVAVAPRDHNKVTARLEHTGELGDEFLAVRHVLSRLERPDEIERIVGVRHL